MNRNKGVGKKENEETPKVKGFVNKNTVVSTLDFKTSTAHGGIKFIKKKKSSQNIDFFWNLKREPKIDLQDEHPTEPGTKEMQMVDSKPAESKDLELSDQVNLENAPPNEAGSLKETSQNLKQNPLKIAMASGDIVFNPKWKSTPVRPNLFGNVQKEIKLRDEELFPADLTPKRLEEPLDSKKVFTKEATELKRVTVDGTVQPRTKEMACFKPQSVTKIQNGEKRYPAFAGLRMIPKRKTSHLSPDIFARRQRKLKSDKQELHPSAETPESEEMVSVDTKAKLITEQAKGMDKEYNQSSTSKRMSENP